MEGSLMVEQFTMASILWASMIGHAVKILWLLFFLSGVYKSNKIDILVFVEDE